MEMYINANYNVSSWLYSLTSELWYQNTDQSYSIGLIRAGIISDCAGNSNLNSSSNS